METRTVETVLPPEQVAEMREHQLGRDARADEDIIDLCDTVDALLEQLREYEQHAIKAQDEKVEYAVSFTQELRDELAGVREQLRVEKEQRYRFQRDLLSCWARLREAKPALLRVTDPDAPYDVPNRTDVATLRALAEMGGSDG